jgi:hypothetical protein
VLLTSANCAIDLLNPAVLAFARLLEITERSRDAAITPVSDVFIIL